MTIAPSEYPEKYVENVFDQVFKLDGHKEVEQSAIYSDVKFHCIQEDETSPGIILTCECDIERASPENYVLVARLASVEDVFSYWLEHKNPYTEEEILGIAAIGRDKAKRSSVLKSFIKTFLHNKSFEYYYLPALDDGFPDSFVCFEITECLPIRLLKPEGKLCVLRSPFREAVPAHYAAYIGRIGTPRFKDQFLTEMLGKICQLRDA